MLCKMLSCCQLFVSVYLFQCMSLTMTVYIIEEKAKVLQYSVFSVPQL